MVGENYLCKNAFSHRENDNHFAILRINIPHVPLLPLKKLIFQMQTIAYTPTICQSSKCGIDIKLFSSLCLIMVKNKSEGKSNFL